MKGSFVLPVAAAAVVAVVLASSIMLYNQGGNANIFPTSGSQLKKFSSMEELVDYVKAPQQAGGGYFGGPVFQGALSDRAGIPEALPAAAGEGKSTATADYSTTNIQVAGVDEPDIVKNDGKYIYTVSGSNVVIVDAYPAEEASVLAEMDTGGAIADIFINGDRLVIFGHLQESYPYPVPLGGEGIAEQDIAAPAIGGIIAPRYPYFYQQKAFVQLYDISDRQNPGITRNITVSGSYYDARMIGDNVYVIINTPVSLFGNGDDVVIPLVAEAGRALPSPTVVFPDVYYFDNPDWSYRFTTIFSIKLNDDSSAPQSRIFLMGDAQNIFVSQDNIYVTYQKNIQPLEMADRLIDEVIIPIVPGLEPQIREIRAQDIPDYQKTQRIQELVGDYMAKLSAEELEQLQADAQQRMQEFQSRLAKELERTIIHRIAIDNGRIEHEAEGSVPGHVLNQFSMDEFEGHFRIATTTSPQYFAGGTAEKQKNHVYVLDGSLNTVGKLEDLAPGESIYSARFISGRAYLVTFKQVDPLFVIDLSDPANPRELGRLKIPGFSNYLHPYDENHIIGIGKDVDESIDADKVHSDDAVYYTAIKGVKLSLFDVSDVEHPREVAKYVIGDRGTESEALQDHKAFLFSREKGLLVIPILLAESSEKPGFDYYTQYAFQGAYVFGLTLDGGFELKGRITHADEAAKNEYYYYGPYAVRRSLYIGNTLYTVSGKVIKMNDLEGLDEINKVELPFEESPSTYPYYR
ncbi:MAG: beta-propeller domain-containing protein [Candidatus Aenigmarchaeota archaeon]|nr:beta-propeller domain-containing protein [Candidatus Aenigmarchaeota archaeon]